MLDYARFHCCAMTASALLSGAFALGQIAVPPVGTISTIAGTGTQGFAGDGGFATNAQIGLVSDVAVDPAGNVYFADTSNNRIAKIDVKAGIISTVAGNGTAAVFGADGNWGDGGPATSAVLNAPWGIAIDKAGDLYITDPQNNVVRKVTVSSGIITTVAGNPRRTSSGDQTLAVNTLISQPDDVAVDGSGNIFIAEGKGNIIQEVFAQTGVIKTIAGNGTHGYSGDGGQAINAQLGTPTSLAIDANGNLYFADYNNYVVRKVTLSTGVITTVAGNGKAEYSGDDGPATSAGLKWPEFVNIDKDGNLYIGDYSDCAVREVKASTGIISRVLGGVDDQGNHICGFSGDGGPATQGETLQNLGAATDGYGNLYVADTKNFRIRLVSSGVVPSNAVYVSVSSSDPKPTMHEAVTIKAKIVDAQNSPVSSGTVAFYSGNTSLGQSTVDANGETAVIATLGPGGDERITAAFADSKSASTGTLALHVSGFSITASPSSISMPKGQVASLALNAAAFYGFTGTVDFSCAGMPLPGSCSLSSNSVTFTNGTPSSNLTLTLKTAATTSAKSESALPGGFALAGLFPLFLFGVRNKRARRALLAVVLAASGGFLSMGLAGCGGSGGSVSSTAEPTTTYVPAGTYTVMVVATSASRTVQLPIMVTLK